MSFRVSKSLEFMYGRLRRRSPSIADVIAGGTDLAFLFHGHAPELNQRHGKSSTWPNTPVRLDWLLEQKCCILFRTMCLHDTQVRRRYLICDDYPRLSIQDVRPAGD